MIEVINFGGILPINEYCFIDFTLGTKGWLEITSIGQKIALKLASSNCCNVLVSDFWAIFRW